MPAFESERYRLDDLPASKAELLKQLDLGNQTKQKKHFCLNRSQYGYFERKISWMADFKGKKKI